MLSLHLDDEIIKSLSKPELNVLKYIYGHGEEVLDMSIQEMAKQVSYSTATVLRFCKKLGYSGFAEFKYALRMEARKVPREVRSAPQADFDSFMIADQICANVESTANLIREEQVGRAFHYFDSDCRIYVWAPGGITSVLAEYFTKMLLSVGRQNVYKIEASKMGEHILQNLPEKSLWILISTTGNFGPTVRLAKLAQMNNVPVISITPYTNNEIADLATVSFRFFTYQREHQGAEFTSRLPVFYLIQTIMRCYLEYKWQREKGISGEVDV